MTSQLSAQSVTNLLESDRPKLATVLAKPWHYRRNGRYYLRFRTQGLPYSTFTVSLRTSNRSTAMEISSNIQRALAYFHLDKPEATWEQLKERLTAIAEECLEIAHGNFGADIAHNEFYREMYGALRQISKQGELSMVQHKAVAIGQSIMAAANARIEGRSGSLVKIIDRLNHDPLRDSHGHISASLSVSAPQEPLTWGDLSVLYMAERRVHLKENSMKAAITAHTVIGRAFEAIGVTDLRGHTRENITALRDKLRESREVSTVNRLLSQLTAVLDWAVRADKIAKAHTDKIKITKGAESKRIAFRRDQVVSLMNHVGTLPESSWERWALSLAVITGARAGEISFLTKADIKQVDGLWCIDINEDTEGKSIKNKHSKRLVPLVDGALGFDLAAFLRAVDAHALPSDNGITPARSSKRLNDMLRDILGDSKGENQKLHSLRHHLIGSMEAAGVPVAHAQAAAGQSSGTIAYDVYGSGSPIPKVYAAIKQGLMGDAQ